MKLASMAGMQVDPVAEEPIKTPEEIEGFEQVVVPVHKGELRADVSQNDEFRKLKRVVRMLHSNKQKEKFSVRGRAMHAYQTQIIEMESPSILGTRLNKAS